jgi:hypothetical protein
MYNETRICNNLKMGSCLGKETPALIITSVFNCRKRIVLSKCDLVSCCITNTTNGHYQRIFNSEKRVLEHLVQQIRCSFEIDEPFLLDFHSENMPSLHRAHSNLDPNRLEHDIREILKIMFSCY